jgi:hypothetical protein
MRSGGEPPEVGGDYPLLLRLPTHQTVYMWEALCRQYVPPVHLEIAQEAPPGLFFGSASVCCCRVYICWLRLVARTQGWSRRLRRTSGSDIVK